MLNPQWTPMDTSYWSSHFPGIKQQPTSKLYFKRFLWRLAIYVPGGELVYSKDPDLYQALEHRRATAISYNWAGSWYARRNNQLNEVDVKLLYLVKNIRDQYGKNIRVRVEEPMLQFYAEDEQTIKDIAQEFTYPVDYKSNVEEINGPVNEAEAGILLSGAIIKRNPSEYQYKVVLRDGRYRVEAKQQVLTYLENLGDQIKITPKCQEMLSRPYPSCWGVFFYTNDLGVATMLRLIDPDIVGNIHEIVVSNK
jgi:hypothetical protein